jgi:hypothetical protein
MGSGSWGIQGEAGIGKGLAQVGLHELGALGLLVHSKY